MAKSLQEALKIFGNLDDAGGSDSPRERFRRYLRDEVFTPEILREYVRTCQLTEGLQYVRAMQDIVNRIGELLGFRVIHGRYHSDSGPVTIDGHWRSDAGHQYLIEVRCGEERPPDPGRMRNFARLLHMAGKLPELNTVVGVYVESKGKVADGSVQRKILESPGKPLIRVVSVDMLIHFYELIRASEISFEDVDRMLSEGSVDIDSGVLSTDSAISSGNESMSNAAHTPQQSNARTPGPTQPNKVPPPRSMQEVARLLEEVNRAGKTAAPQQTKNATQGRSMPHQNAVTRKKEIRLTNLSSGQSASRTGAPQSGNYSPGAAALMVDEAENAAPGFNATLNDSRMNMMPELPAGSWRESLTATDEQLFDAVSGVRKKPFIHFGLGRKGTEKAEEKHAEGVFSGIFAGLGRHSKPKKKAHPIAENYEKVTVGEVIKPDTGKLDIPAPTSAKVESVQPARVEQPTRSAPPPAHVQETPAEPLPVQPVKGEPAALEEHDALIRIIRRLWPYPEFRDYAVDVFTCGAKAHDLNRDDVEELLSLVEVHSRRR